MGWEIAPVTAGLLGAPLPVLLPAIGYALGRRDQTDFTGEFSRFKFGATLGVLALLAGADILALIFLIAFEI